MLNTMSCDICQRKINYCFYVNDDDWFEVVGKKEGHWCAHCILEELGGEDWYIIWNEPSHKIRLNAFDEREKELENEC